MARWKLGTPHTLWIKGVTWEYKEVDRATGKFVRKTWNVPRPLDPNDPGDWNVQLGRDDGMIVVCLPGKGEPNDFEFYKNSKYDEPGQPTPDMEPIDAEAKAISAELQKKWGAPQSGAYTEGLVEGWHKQMAELQASGVKNNESMTELLTAIAAIIKQNQEIIQMVAGKAPVEPAKVARRA